MNGHEGSAGTGIKEGAVGGEDTKCEQSSIQILGPNNPSLVISSQERNGRLVSKSEGLVSRASNQGLTGETERMVKVTKERLLPIQR